jgi:hypothetical protein
MDVNINWNYPKPRAGFAGALDKLFGPGSGMVRSLLVPEADRQPRIAGRTLPSSRRKKHC